MAPSIVEPRSGLVFGVVSEDVDGNADDAVRRRLQVPPLEIVDERTEQHVAILGNVGYRDPGSGDGPSGVRVSPAERGELRRLISEFDAVDHRPDDGVLDVLIRINRRVRTDRLYLQDVRVRAYLDGRTAFRVGGVGVV